MSRRLAFNLFHQPGSDDAIGNADNRQAVLASGDGELPTRSLLLREQVMAWRQTFQLERVARSKMVGLADLLRNVNQSIRIQCCFHGMNLRALEPFAKPLVISFKLGNQEDKERIVQLEKKSEASGRRN